MIYHLFNEDLNHFYPLIDNGPITFYLFLHHLFMLSLVVYYFDLVRENLIIRKKSVSCCCFTDDDAYDYAFSYFDYFHLIKTLKLFTTYGCVSVVSYLAHISVMVLLNDVGINHTHAAQMEIKYLLLVWDLMKPFQVVITLIYLYYLLIRKDLTII